MDGSVISILPILNNLHLWHRRTTGLVDHQMLQIFVDAGRLIHLEVPEYLVKVSIHVLLYFA